MRLGQRLLVLPFVAVLFFSCFSLLSASSLEKRKGPPQAQAPPPKRPSASGIASGDAPGLSRGASTHVRSSKGSPHHDLISTLADPHLGIGERERVAAKLLGQLGTLCIGATIDSLLLKSQSARARSELAETLVAFVQNLRPTGSPAPSPKLEEIRSLASNLQKLLSDDGLAELAYFGPQLQSLKGKLPSQLREMALELIPARLALLLDPNPSPESFFQKVSTFLFEFTGKSLEDDGYGSVEGLLNLPQPLPLVVCKFLLKILLLMIQSVEEPEADQLRRLSEGLGSFMELLNKTHDSLSSNPSLHPQQQLNAIKELEANLKALLHPAQEPNFPTTTRKHDQRDETKPTEAALRGAFEALRNLQAIISASESHQKFGPGASAMVKPHTADHRSSFLQWYGNYKEHFGSLENWIDSSIRQRGLLELCLVEKILQSTQACLGGLPYEYLLGDVRIDVNSATVHLPRFLKSPSLEDAHKYFAQLENFSFPIAPAESVLENVSNYSSLTFAEFFTRHKRALEMRYQILRLLKGVVHPYQIPEFYLAYWVPFQRLSFFLKNLWSTTLIALRTGKCQYPPKDVTTLIENYQYRYQELLKLWEGCHALTGQATPSAEASSWSLEPIMNLPEFKRVKEED